MVEVTLSLDLQFHRLAFGCQTVGFRSSPFFSSFILFITKVFKYFVLYQEKYFYIYVSETIATEEIKRLKN